MLRKYVQVDDDNIATGPCYVHGEVDAPFPVIPHDNPETVEVGTKWDGSDEQASWSAYRTALLGVPQQEDFPLNVIWPTR